MTIKGGAINVTNGTASIKVSCPAQLAGNCTGSLTLRTAKSIKLAGLNTVLQFGSARYNLAPGTASTVKVKLPKHIQRLADRKGHLRVVAIASTGASGKIASSTQHATLALGTSTKRK